MELKAEGLAYYHLLSRAEHTQMDLVPKRKSAPALSLLLSLSLSRNRVQHLLSRLSRYLHSWCLQIKVFVLQNGRNSCFYNISSHCSMGSSKRSIQNGIWSSERRMVLRNRRVSNPPFSSTIYGKTSSSLIILTKHAFAILYTILGKTSYTLT